MILVAFMVRVVVVVVTMLAVAALVIVRPSNLWRIRTQYRSRLRAVAPLLAVLGVSFATTGVVRRIGTELSWIIGWSITDDIYALEGMFVAQLQSLATPPLTTYFASIYIYGYVFLLVFPLIAYFALDELEPLRETAIAYTINYWIGLICYTTFIAYGPRNMMPDLVESLLYTTWPRAQLLTSEVNTNTNVFPSLHTSLSVTIALLAYRTRDRYPAWTPLAIGLAASVAVATMYLGIHWATDVVAGVFLGCISVYAATRLTASSVIDRWITARWLALRRRLGRWLPSD